MTMKKKNIVIIVLLIFFAMMIVGTVSRADTIDVDPNEFDPIYERDDSLFSIGEKIVGVVSYICYGAAVIILLYKGVQFMMKAPEAKAEAKKELVSYAVGAFILFGIGTIIQIIGNIAKNSLFG